MATFYVDATGGSDAAAGTSPAAAWQTIAKVNGEAFVPGDSILFKRGEVWREQLTVPSSGSSTNPITFGAYNSGNKPVINGADIITGWALDAGTTYKVTLTTEPKIAAVDDTKAVLGTGAGTLNDGEWFWVADELFYRSDAGNPDTQGLVVEAAQRDRGISLSVKNYVTFENLRVALANVDNVYLEGGPAQGHIIDTLTIGPAGSVGFKMVSTKAGIFRNNLIEAGMNGDCLFIQNIQISLLVENNTIFASDGIANDDDGMHIQNVKNATIQNNTVNLTGHGGTKGCIKVSDNVPAGPVRTDNVLIQDNTCLYGNWGVSVTGTNINVRRNTIKYQGQETGNTSASGIWLEDADSSSATFSHNVITGCQNGISFLNNDYVDHTFYNNTIVDSTRFDVNASPGSAISGEFKNNILSSPSASQKAIEITAIADGGSGAWVSDNNVIDDTAGFKIETVEYATLALLVSGTGRDANSLNQDPVFLDASSEDYRLQATSPAIDAGTPVGLLTDFDGVSIPQGSAPDIGAHEFVSCPQVKTAANVFALNETARTGVTDPFTRNLTAGNIAAFGCTSDVISGLGV